MERQDITGHNTMAGMSEIFGTSVSLLVAFVIVYWFAGTSRTAWGVVLSGLLAIAALLYAAVHLS